MFYNTSPTPISNKRVAIKQKPVSPGSVLRCNKRPEPRGRLVKDVFIINHYEDNDDKSPDIEKWDEKGTVKWTYVSNKHQE